MGRLRKRSGVHSPMSTPGFYRALGARLQHVRLRTHRTQRQLADVLGVARASYANIEQGHRRLLVSDLALIAQFYGVELYMLLPTASEIEAASTDPHSASA